MPRKKPKTTETEPVETNTAATAVAEPAEAQAAPTAGDAHADGPANPEAKNWGDPYKAIFTCPEMGFELGENRRFKQRAFHFIDKPSDEILAELKENRFIYRGAEKAWTIPANAQTRKLTDDLARKWAGPSYAAGIER